MLPVECVVRGYLTGSGWAEYQESGTVCGIPLPAGSPERRPPARADLHPGVTRRRWASTTRTSRSSDRRARRRRRAAEQLRDASLEIYGRAAATAEEHGLILADTKFEFGVDADGRAALADEVLTSDSSRYWDAEAWQHAARRPTERMASFDKQIVRDWLAANWDKQGTPPELPAEIVERTADRYRELLERLTAA